MLDLRGDVVEDRVLPADPDLGARHVVVDRPHPPVELVVRGVLLVGGEVVVDLHQDKRRPPVLGAHGRVRGVVPADGGQHVPLVADFGRRVLHGRTQLRVVHLVVVDEHHHLLADVGDVRKQVAAPYRVAARRGVLGVRQPVEDLGTQPEADDDECQPSGGDPTVVSVTEPTERGEHPRTVSSGTGAKGAVAVRSDPVIDGSKAHVPRLAMRQPLPRVRHFR